MPKRNLTDRTLRALKPAAPGKTVDVWDSTVAGFGARVSDSGRRTFVLMARYSDSGNPTRRAIGVYDEISLADARAKAVEWKKLIGKGIDPAVAEEEARQAALRRREITFAAVVRDYFRQQVIGINPDKPRQRNGKEVERYFGRAFIPIWGNRPITSITKIDVRDVIEDVRDYGTAAMLGKRGIKKKGDKIEGVPAPGHARNLLSYLKTFFSWVIERDDFGLETSPCDRLKAKSIFGDRQSSGRTLSDSEIFACWRAAQRMGYPFGSIYMLLLLTGLRLYEVADAAWAEFDIAKGLWTIPAERMKGKPGMARPHTVPLTSKILEILETLPRLTSGDFLFSATFGATPVWMTDKGKRRIDARMLRTLRAFARMRGADPEMVKLEAWVNHDLRRTLRSRLSELRVSSDVAEAVLAHVKPGIRGVYDRHEYLDEKRHALELWAGKLCDIVRPAEANVIPLRATAAR
jgi:integrase